MDTRSPFRKAASLQQLCSRAVSPERCPATRGPRTPWLGFVSGISRPHGVRATWFLSRGMGACSSAPQLATLHDPSGPKPSPAGWRHTCAAGPTRKASTRLPAAPGNLSFKAPHGCLVPTSAADPVLTWFHRHSVATDSEHQAWPQQRGAWERLLHAERGSGQVCPASTLPYAEALGPTGCFPRGSLADFMERLSGLGVRPAGLPGALAMQGAGRRPQASGAGPWPPHRPSRATVGANSRGGLAAEPRAPGVKGIDLEPERQVTGAQA